MVIELTESAFLTAAFFATIFVLALLISGLVQTFPILVDCYNYLTALLYETGLLHVLHRKKKGHCG